MADVNAVVQPAGLLSSCLPRGGGLGSRQLAAPATQSKPVVVVPGAGWAPSGLFGPHTGPIVPAAGRGSTARPRGGGAAGARRRDRAIASRLLHV
jgi:hypothetical protein